MTTITIHHFRLKDAGDRKSSPCFEETQQPVPAQPCPSVDPCTEELLQQRGWLQVELPWLGQLIEETQSRPQGKKAHPGVCVMLRRWGR